MTDNEIIKALECCKSKCDCSGCLLKKEEYCVNVLKNLTLDLINRQKAEMEKNENIIRLADKAIETQNAEIERLKATVDSFTDIGKLYSEIKAEAYKEFAERLKMRAINRYNEFEDYQAYPYATIEHIDNLLKELVGDNDES